MPCTLARRHTLCCQRPVHEHDEVCGFIGAHGSWCNRHKITTTLFLLCCLQVLVELAQERDEDIPALVYEARSTRRGQRGLSQPQTGAGPHHSQSARLPQATSTGSIMGTAASASADCPSEADVAADQGKIDLSVVSTLCTEIVALEREVLWSFCLLPGKY